MVKKGFILNENKRKWNPFSVGDRFYLKPPGFAEIAGDKINITLGPGSAFGSGEHETTRDCLEMMASFKFLAHYRVLDFGTGTGILAISAAKSGADFVFALDIDYNAALACQNNARLNSVNNNVFAVCGDLVCLKSRSQFEFIIANLYADILFERASLLAQLLAVNGSLLLSGISFDYLYDVKQCFQRLNMQILRQKIGDEYCTILVKV